MSIAKIVKEKDLMKDAMQSLAYFAFIGAFFKLGIPAVKGDFIQISLFILAIIPMSLFVIVFTLIHVVRPIVQHYYPIYGVKDFDDNYKPLGFFHGANWLASIISLFYILTGILIASFGFPK